MRSIWLCVCGFGERAWACVVLRSVRDFGVIQIWPLPVLLLLRLLEGDSRQGCQRVQNMDAALWISSGFLRVLSANDEN